MLEFLKKWILFKIDPKEREIYRDRVMKGDHKIYRSLLVVIFVLQLLMLGMSFITTRNADVEVIAYRCCYCFLAIICFVCFFITESAYKKGKKFLYFTIVSLTMFAIMLWGGAISLIDSKEHTNLVYFSIALIAASAFITLEPWVTILASSLTVVLFDVAFAILSKSFDVFIPIQGFGFFIATATVVAICWIGSSFNFYKRIKAIGLELEVSELNTTLKKQTILDELTKVHNRRYLTENIDNPLNYGEPGSAILLLDVDNFKKINDMYGHQVGDDCLSFVGEQLNKITYGEKDYCVRYGGDEFLCYFDCVSEERIFEIKSKLEKNISSSKIKMRGGNSISFEISVGVAFARNNISYNDLINQADISLYKVKDSKRK